MRNLILILFLIYSVESYADMFLTGKNEISGRWAIVEEIGGVCYLYLTERGSQKPVNSVIVFANKLQTKEEAKETMQNGIAPSLVAEYASSIHNIAQPDENEFAFVWKRGGELVELMYKNQVIAVLTNESSYSQAISKSGFYGEPLKSYH